MDYNKDLTMESDFIGQFNYPAGRRPSNHNNIVDTSVIKDAVNDYLDKHPVSGADVPTTDIDFSNWEGGDN